MNLGGMNRAGGKIILWLLILTMLIYTATRTLHFLQITLPDDQQYVAWLALVAFDIGVLGWFYYASHSAEGVQQRTVAYGMIFVCVAGVLITTMADMLISSEKHGVVAMPPEMGKIALWVVIGVIVLNVLGGIVVHLVDPKHQRHLAKETAKDLIHSAALNAMAQKASEIAPRIATRVALAFEDEVITEMVGHLPPAQQSAVASRLLNTGRASAISQDEADQLDRSSVPAAKPAAGLPAPKDEEKNGGIIGSLKKMFAGNGGEGETQAASLTHEDDQEELEPVQTRRTAIRPEAHIVRPEPSVVGDRRRARYQHFHGAPGPRRQTDEERERAARDFLKKREALLNKQPEATVPDGSGPVPDLEGEQEEEVVVPPGSEGEQISSHSKKNIRRPLKHRGGNDQTKR